MKYLYALLLCAALAAPAYARQLAYTVRSTEIKQQPFSDAATVATLKENTGVDILSRQGGWVRITSESGNGWVKMLSLRSDTTAAKQGDSGLQSLLNAGRSGSSGTTVVTGVRGLSEEDLKNAKPNPGEFEKLQNYAAGKAQAEKFARDAKLKTQRLDYLPLDGR
ncbi:MAG: SH3 domain-containing protein [Gallionella sp.]|nr:SH3 domain-containing protein [Gallionella sp.]